MFSVCQAEVIYAHPLLWAGPVPYKETVEKMLTRKISLLKAVDIMYSALNSVFFQLSYVTALWKSG